MISDAQKQAVRRSWRLVVPSVETLAELFYARLFELQPAYRQLFSADLTPQKRKLVNMLAFVVKTLEWDDRDWRRDVASDEDLMLVMLALGRRHSELYKVPPNSYEAVGESLLWALERELGGAFTAEEKEAWSYLYLLLAQTMRMGGATIDREGALGSADAAFQQGEVALRVQLSEARSDRTRGEYAEEAS